MNHKNVSGEEEPFSRWNLELAEVSGPVSDPTPLTSFLYVLMKDHLPVGVVDQIVNSNEDAGFEYKPFFINGYLAKHAQYLAERLNG